jgi:hypothetical protein
MIRKRLLSVIGVKALAGVLLLSQAGCLEITVGNEPQQQPQYQDLGPSEDVAINPESSPYYTEPLLPEPTINIANESISAMSATGTRTMPEFDVPGAPPRQSMVVLKEANVVGTGEMKDANGDDKILVLARDASAYLTVPKTLDGKPTHIEVVGEIKATAYNTRAKYRPVIPSGVSVGNGRENSSGTIGAVVVKNGIRYMLSNNHVLARQNNARIGEQIVQPGRADTRGVPTETVAILSAYKPVSFTSRNTIDAAIARYTGWHSYSVVDKAFAPSHTPVIAHSGQKVMKMGRTTGLTYGTVQSTNVTIKVDFNGQTAIFENQIYIKGDYSEFLQAGDSGSLLVTQSGQNPVGLLFAGGEGSAFANPIGDVLNYFGVTLAGK